jgi:hypothetical protein
MDMTNLNWTPLLKNPSSVVENYVNQNQTISSVETVLIGIALMVGAALIAVLFYWVYNNGGSTLIVVVFSLFVFLYVAKVITLLVYIRRFLSERLFQLYIGSAVSMGLISLTLFSIFYSKHSRRSLSSSSPSAFTQQPPGF